MKILRRNLLRLWMVGSSLWVVLLIVAHRGVLTDEEVFVAVLLPIILFFVGLGLTRIWELFGVMHWLSLPAHVRRGLQRVYLVLAVPWVAWYGYQIYDFVHAHYYWHWHDISHSFWALLIVPIGAPVCLMALFWVLAGFRQSPPDTNATPGKVEVSAKIRDKVASDIINRPDVAVAVFLHKNRAKLRTEDLTREQEASLPKELLAKNGISIDELARHFGYQHSDVMVDRLVQFEKNRGDTSIEKYIEKLTNEAVGRRMQREQGGVPDSSDRPSPEIDAIFKKLDRLMTDEKAQCDGLPEPFRSKVLGGDDCDEIVGAAGEFGRDHRNPIPVNGPLGELIYLSNLRTTKSQQIMFHRLGSAGNIDVYETVSFDGAAWDILFLDLYHPRKSRQAPRRYRICSGAERESLLFGANEFVAPFPDHLQDAIASTYKRLLGGRMRPRQVREAIERVSFKRPADHQAILDSVTAKLDAKAYSAPLDENENVESRTKPFYANATNDERRDWFAHTRPWNRIAPKVIDAILDGITDKVLLEVFVKASMEHNLVARYEPLGQEGSDDPTIIRAQVSHILCTIGNRAIPRLAEALDSKRTDVGEKALMAAVDTFEPAVALAKNQIVAYAGMAIACAMIGKSAESHDWAKRGLVELTEIRAEMRRLHLSGDESPYMWNRDDLDQMERQLRSCLEE